jgi:hypothetical protein
MQNGILLLLVMLCASAGPATRPTDNNIDGTWKSKGMMDIMGGSTDRQLEIAPADKPAAKTVTMTRVENPRFRDRREEPKAVRFGPFDARIEERTLIVSHPAGPARYSFTSDGETLSLPGFVRKGHKEIFIEATELLDLDVRSDIGKPPPLTVYEWRWVFSAAPESAERGTGHFTAKATPDPLKFSTAFDFEWEWREDRVGRRIMIWRKDASGKLAESGGFLVGKTGAMRWYSSGGDRVGTSGIERGYVRAEGPTSGPTTRPKP